MYEPRMVNSIEIEQRSNTSKSMATANGERLSALTQ